MKDTDVIDALGGTNKVAEICNVRPPSVSEWRRKGIPAARRQFLQLLRPEVFSSAPAANDDTAPAEGEGAVEGAS